MKQSIFERYPKSTLFGVIITSLFFILFLAEMAAGHLFGLGKTVIYDAHPVYGYRPVSNQIVARHPSQIVKINNIGLRANVDWDPNDFQHKVLFLGDSVTYGGSYISNEQLFSHLAVKDFPEYSSGNAGVNGWGVNNVHALVKEMDFLPAQIYVSMFPEGDFYRGHNRIGGQPLWTRKPHFALEELFQYFVYQIHLKKTPVINYAALDENQRNKIVNVAVKNLKSLDGFLKENHRDHLIYITPSRSQMLGIAPIDQTIKSLFEKNHVDVIYLLDKMDKMPKEEIQALYHDEIHLSEKGHQLWAKLIAEDLQEIIQAHEKESILVQKLQTARKT